MNRFTRKAAALAAGLSLLAGSLAAHAEGQIRIAEQFGIVYLLLNVAQDQKLIEKHAKAANDQGRGVVQAVNTAKGIETKPAAKAAAKAESKAEKA